MLYTGIVANSFLLTTFDTVYFLTLCPLSIDGTAPSAAIMSCELSSLTGNFYYGTCLTHHFIVAIYLTVSQKLMFMHVSAVSAGIAAWPPDRIQRLSLRSPRMPHPQKTTQPTAPTVKQGMPPHLADRTKPWYSSPLNTPQPHPGYPPHPRRLWTQL